MVTGNTSIEIDGATGIRRQFAPGGSGTSSSSASSGAQALERGRRQLNQLTEIVLATTPVREATDEQLVVADR